VPLLHPAAEGRPALLLGLARRVCRRASTAIRWSQLIATVAIRDDGTIGLTYFNFRKNTLDAAKLAADAKRDSPRWKSPPLVGETAT